MDLSTLMSVVGFFALMGAGAFIAWDRHRMCTAEIEGSLGRVHAREIKLKFDWMDFDRDTFTYDVEYRDQAGKMHYNRCKVATRIGADSYVYWSHPIAPGPSTRR